MILQKPRCPGRESHMCCMVQNRPKTANTLKSHYSQEESIGILPSKNTKSGIGLYTSVIQSIEIVKG